MHEEPLQAENQESSLIIKQYSKKEIEKNLKLISRLRDVNDKISENKSARGSSRNVYNSDYDITIYTDAATYIENGDYHSYTFPLVQEDDEKMTNVLFELNDQDEYDAYIVRYDYTAYEFNTQDLNTLSLETAMIPIDLDFDSISERAYAAFVCVFSYDRVCCDNWVPELGCGQLTGADYYNPGCHPWVLRADHCEYVMFEDQDYTNYQNNTATVTISGTNYGGTGGSNTSPMPSPFDAEELMKINVVKSELDLNHLQRNWIDEWENGQYAFQIYVYGLTHMWSDEAKSFCKAAVNALMDDGEVDFVNELIFSHAFKQTRAHCVIKLLTATNNNLFQDVISQFTSNNSKKKLRFLHEPLSLPNGENDTTTEANTSPPDPLGVSTIRFNSNTNSANANSLEIANNILHEAIHAELFRIVEGGNNVPEPLPQDLYDLMIYFLDYYENNGIPQYTISNAQHAFMANNYVGAIANAVRNFDNNTHPLENYISIGWEGLSQFGTTTLPTPLVSMQEINNYYVLAGVPLNDNHNLSCDE